MNELVYLKRNEAFTDSEVIAKVSGVTRDAVQKLIMKYESDFSDYGKLRFEIRPSENGQNIKVYLLSEEQATLLLTYMKNTKKVREFKKELVRQFYMMRKLLAEKQTSEWVQMRQTGKLTRKAETDTIKELVELAKEQGSTHADMLYMTYSKLANKMAGISGRDNASFTQLNDLNIFEQIILNIIRQGIIADRNYKQIYHDCKERCEAAKQIAFIGES